MFEPNKLVLPDLHKEPEHAPDYGMLELPRAAYTYEPKGESYSYPSSKDFGETFQEFCLETTMSKRCTILALQQIRQLCFDVLKRDVFKTTFSKEMKYEEFKSTQESQAAQLMSSLKDQWLNDVTLCIKEHFKNEKEGWFNLNSVTQANYHTGKLKSFLNLVRLTMQTTLRNLVYTNFNKYVVAIKSFIPQTIEIISETEVVNVYPDGQKIDSREEPDYKKTHVPLFSLDLRVNNGLIAYSQSPSHFKGCVLKAFSSTLEELGRIHDVESKVLDNKIRRKDNYLVCPRLEAEKPVVPDPNIRPKEYESEDAWVWYLYNDLLRLSNHFE